MTEQLSIINIFQDYLLELFEPFSLFLHDNQISLFSYKNVLNVSLSSLIMFLCFKLVFTYVSLENASTMCFQYSWKKTTIGFTIFVAYNSHDHIFLPEHFTD